MYFCRFVIRYNYNVIIAVVFIKSIIEMRVLLINDHRSRVASNTFYIYTYIILIIILLLKTILVGLHQWYVHSYTTSFSVKLKKLSLVQGTTLKYK